MLLSSLVAVALAACAVRAFPAPETGLASHPAVARDVAGQSSSSPLLLSHKNTGLKGQGKSASNFTSNWAGAVYAGYPASTFRHITGTIIVPGTVTPPKGGDNNTIYRGTAWIGIDGSSCQKAVLQTGVDWAVQGGQVTYDAWYEWFPAPQLSFPGGLAIHAGDTLRFTIDSKSASSGVATIENLTTGVSVTHSVTSNVTLCAADAEWIVEDYSINNVGVPFANFGSVTFSNAVATVNGGAGGTLGPVYATLLDLKLNGTVLTQSSTTDSTVTVNYSG